MMRKLEPTRLGKTCQNFVQGGIKIKASTNISSRPSGNIWGWRFQKLVQWFLTVLRVKGRVPTGHFSDFSLAGWKLAENGNHVFSTKTLPGWHFAKIGRFPEPKLKSSPDLIFTWEASRCIVTRLLPAQSYCRPEQSRPWSLIWHLVWLAALPFSNYWSREKSCSAELLYGPNQLYIEINFNQFEEL